MLALCIDTPAPNAVFLKRLLNRLSTALNVVSAPRGGESPPEDIRELGVRNSAMEVCREIGKDEAALSAGQCGLIERQRPVVLDGESSSEIDLSFWLAYWANVDPRLDVLRHDARFKTLLRRLGLPT